ncbi:MULTISPECIES: hypothetical protein [Pantoea]|uniref:Uncharacterized protein n=1 Tax=Pantoea dispersa TaxID=59814 RepID=A0ABY3A472_9GAMM|nr:MULTISPECIES: hypothetical protein [Pantoea]TQC76444.1 hypothetical protein FK492_00075 [Pantoea dispersa]
MTTVTHEKVKSTKIALYRTRLRVLHQENFSVLFFYKPPHRAAMLLAFCRSTPTEMSEKNFSFFQFLLFQDCRKFFSGDCFRRDF